MTDHYDNGIKKRPSLDLLGEFAPKKAWQEAYALAENGPLKRFNVGSVIFDPESDRILSRGVSSYKAEHTCCHELPKNLGTTATVHAEADAIANAPQTSLVGATALVVVVNVKGNHSWSARSCLACMRAMSEVGIKNVMFAERTESGWLIHDEDVAATTSKFDHVGNDFTFARHMQLPASAKALQFIGLLT